MGKRTKLGIGIGALLLIGVFVAIAATRGNGNATQVRIETVAQRDLIASVTANGWIRPNRKVDVQSDIMGRIIELLVDEGQEVKKGQVLLRIDPTQYEAAVVRARAAVAEMQARQAQTRANLIQAERTHKRYQDMAKANANLVSRQQIEEAETQVLVQTELLQAAKYSVAQAEAQLAEARDQLAKTVIRAPMDGVITRLNVEEGETAIVGTMNNSGSLLLTVADLGEMEAVVRVDETDMPEVQLGDSATIEIDAFPRQKFVGRVTEISHSSTRPPDQQQAGATSGQAVDFEVVIKLDNPPRTLRSDLSATAEIVTAVRPNALSVPIIALTVRERGSLKALPNENEQAKAAGEAAEKDDAEDVEGVFVARGGKAVFVPVQIGVNGREHFEIISGLQAGDSVIAGPYEAIRALESDKAIRPMPAAAAGSASGASKKESK